MEEKKEYISIKQARAELGEQGYFAFHRWLTEKGYRNLNEKFVTRDQLKEFARQTAQDFRSDESTSALWGQTREFWRRQGLKKKKR